MQVEGDERGPPPDDSDRLSVAEIHDSINAISDADMARLVSAAQGFSRLCGIDPEDLLQEAFTRALEGRRTCERGTALVPFICGVMKSFVSQENEARKDGFRPTVILRKGEPIVELQDLLGVDEKGLAAVRKRLRRLLQEARASEFAS